MAGNRLNNYDTLDNNITEMQLTEDASFVGKHTVSLTNYDTTGVPQIAAGSIVEVAGTLYKFNSAESIAGSPSDGNTYIQIVPGGATCTAQFTNTAPTWSDAKQGFYGTGAAATYRYLEYIMNKSGSTYIGKRTITYDDFINAIGVYDLSAATATITTANITTANITNLNVTTKTLVSIYKSVLQSITTINPTLIIFDLEYYDTQSEFDVSTSSFITTKAGYYLITGQIAIWGQTTGAFYPGIYVNGIKAREVAVNDIIQERSLASLNYLVYLNIGDILQFYIYSFNDSSYSVSDIGTAINIMSV
jgi:hypothetical protein